MGLSSSKTYTCFVNGKNVGKPDCEINPKNMKGGFFIPHGTIIPSSAVASVAALRAYLIAQNILDSVALVWNHVGPWESFEDQSVAPQSQTLPNQRQIMTDRGRKVWEYTYLEGGFEHYLRMLQFNGKHKQYDYIGYDEDNIMWCVFAGVDANNLDTFQGFDLDMIYVYEWKDPNNNEVVQYRIRIAPSMGTQLNEDLRIMKPDFDIRRKINAVSIKEVDIINRTPTGAAAGVFHIELKHGSINLVAALGAAIANTNAVKARLTSTGAALTLTSVAPSVDGTYAVVTFNTGGSGYDAAAPAQIYLPATSVLAALTPAVKYYSATVPCDIVLS